MQKSPTSIPFLNKKHTSLIINSLQRQQQQKQLEAISKAERRHTEGRAKGKRRLSVTSLNINHFTPNPSLCIICNKNEENLKN